MSPGRLVTKNARAGIAGTQAQLVSFPQVGEASQTGATRREVLVATIRTIAGTGGLHGSAPHPTTSADSPPQSMNHTSFSRAGGGRHGWCALRRKLLQ